MQRSALTSQEPKSYMKKFRKCCFDVILRDCSKNSVVSSSNGNLRLSLESQEICVYFACESMEVSHPLPSLSTPNSEVLVKAFKGENFHFTTLTSALLSSQVGI